MMPPPPQKIPVQRGRVGQPRDLNGLLEGRAPMMPPPLKRRLGQPHDLDKHIVHVHPELVLVEVAQFFKPVGVLEGTSSLR
jgi:hypothetical protein